MSIFLSEPVQVLVSINLLLTLSLLFPFLAGVWSLGLPGFMATGAYVAGWLSLSLDYPPWLAIGIGAMAGALISLPFGLLSLRIRGIYLSIATLAAAELITLFFSHFKPTGGVMGLAGIPYVEPVWIMATAAGAFGFSLVLYRSRLGKVLFAVGSDPLVAACNGVNVPLLQSLALIFSGALAGLAGGLFAHYYSFISPANFAFSRTVDILLFLVTGGVTPLGALVGSVVLTLIPQFFAGLETWAPAFYAAVVIVTMAVLPGGVFPKNRVTQWLRRVKRAPAPAAAAPRMRERTAS